MADEDMIAEFEGTSTGNVYIHGPGTDEPWALMTRKGSYYYHADGLGSIMAITDGSRRTVQEYEYDFFGNGAFGGLHDMKNRIKQPYAFTGREFDRDTRLYYYRARYYDPGTGRFTQQDPKGTDARTCTSAYVSQYIYVNNNPALFTDSTGKEIDQSCNSSQKASIEAALSKIRAAVPSCVQGPSATLILSKVNWVTINCSANNSTCGWRPFGNHSNIFLGSIAFNSPRSCGCLEGTLLHEIAHSVGYLYEEDAYGCARGCFTCAKAYSGN